MSLVPVYSSFTQWQQACSADHHDHNTGDDNPQALLTQRVSGLLQRVRTQGDAALHDIVKELGDALPSTFAENGWRLGPAAMRKQINSLSADTKQTLEAAAQRIQTFAQTIATHVTRSVTLQEPGVQAGLRFIPVDRVACYVPGGRYPLPSSALMTALSAQAAGVPSIAMFCPRPTPEVLFAAQLAGVSEIYHLGGAQAVAAAAYGTASIPRCDMLVGPGNAYVTEAKRQLQGHIGIDMLAGPSEVGIVADDSARLDWLALDVLSQCEHDPEARAVVAVSNKRIALELQAEINRQQQAIPQLPSFIAQALSQSALVVTPTDEEAVTLMNTMAPEHLHLHGPKAEALREQFRHYGALFIGAWATVPYGDYASGPNHTLPTNQTARFSSGLSPLTFLRTQSWFDVQQPQSNTAQTIAQTTVAFAQLEGLVGHAHAAQLRLDAHP